MKDEKQWPFDQPRNCAAISLRSIVFNGNSILYVTHDADDHGWQFFDGKNADMNDAAVVALGDIVELDSSVLEIADLPVGWRAWRNSVSNRWFRESIQTKEQSQ
jgi:hypothetical protein